MKTLLNVDPAFRRIVVASTGLGLAAMLGSVAAIRIGPATGLQFEFHWSVILVGLAGVLWNRRFWKLVWQSETEISKRKLIGQLAVLLCLGLGSFLYPIRFIEQSYWSGILKGLITATAFLGTLGWIVYRSGRALSQMDAAELERQGQTEP